MKRNTRRLPIPQYEFAFVAETFNLFSEVATRNECPVDGLIEYQDARCDADAQQIAVVRPSDTPLRVASPFRLRAGDVVRFEGEPCKVFRVNDCAAVIEVVRPPKEFTTIFGKHVRIQPRPLLVRISSNSLCPILNRETEP